MKNGFLYDRYGELWIKLLWRSNWFYNYSIFISCFSKSWPLPCSTAGIHLLRGRLKCVTGRVKEEIPMQYFWHSNWIIHKQYVWKAGSYPEEGFSILLIFLFQINSYTPENSSNSVSPGKKREWIYLQWQREKHIGVAEAQLPSSLSLLERMCVFKCALGFYILRKELNIAHKKFSGQDPLLSGKLFPFSTNNCWLQGNLSNKPTQQDEKKVLCVA